MKLEKTDMKSRFKLFILASVTIHLAGSCFFQKTPLFNKDTARKEADTVDSIENNRSVTAEHITGTYKERFEKLVKPYVGEKEIAELWRAESSFVKDVITRGDRISGDELTLATRQQAAMDEIRNRLTSEIAKKVKEDGDDCTSIEFGQMLERLLKADIKSLIKQSEHLFSEMELKKMVAFEAKSILTDQLGRFNRSAKGYSEQKRQWESIDSVDVERIVHDMSDTQERHVGTRLDGRGKMGGGSRYSDLLKSRSALLIKGPKGYSYNRKDKNLLNDLAVPDVTPVKPNLYWKPFSRSAKHYYNKMKKRKIMIPSIQKRKANRVFNKTEIRKHSWPALMTSSTFNSLKSDAVPGEMCKPDFPVNKWGGAVRCTGPVAIDGYLNEWDGIQPYALYGRNTLPSVTYGNYLMMQWDNRGLYFAYRIKDVRDNPFERHIYYNDVINLFIDPFNSKQPKKWKYRNSEDRLYHVSEHLN